MELSEIFSKLEQKDDFECGEPQSEEDIGRLEGRLKFSFPEDYKIFLKKYGYIRWKEGKIYGISKRLENDLVHRNSLVREDIQPTEFMKLPDDAILIQDYGDAFFMLFDKNALQKGSVFLYLSEHPQYAEKSWESFKEFLEEYCL